MSSKCIRIINLGIFTILTLLVFSQFVLGAEVDSYVRYTPSCKAKAMSGKLEIVEAQTEYTYEFKVWDKLPVEFSIGSGYIGIENTTEVDLPAHLTAMTTEIETTLPLFNLRNTYFRLNISPSLYGEDWDFVSANFRIPQHYLAIYQPNEKWTFIGGIGVYPDFEREISPIFGLIYKPNDKLTFDLVPKRPNIAYAINDKLTLFGEGGIGSKEFEVNLHGFKNKVLAYKETRLGGGIKYKLNRFIETSVQAGGIFNRTLKYRDSLGKVNIKDGVYSEFRVKAEF